MGENLLEVQDLKLYFKVKAGKVRAVDGVSFAIKPGEKVGIVGESGCGKSVTALSIMRLIPQPPGEYAGGSVLFEGQDLLELPESAMRKIRGSQIGMIFQDPMTCLNPTMMVGKQIAEGLRIHLKLSNEQAQLRAVSLLEQVGIPDAATRVNAYPHQFSGGMRQRVGISQEFGTAVIIITHDLGVVAGMTDRVVVMYAGKVVETASTDELFANPRHPYTLGLLSSVPRLDEQRHAELRTIEGAPPDLLKPPPGCPFMPRCAFARAICRTMPPLDPVAGKAEHLKACWVDVTDPKEQAYADKRRNDRLEALRVAIKASEDAIVQTS